MKSHRYYLILLTLLASLIPAMHAQTFSVIHAFTGGADGAAPVAGVTIKGNALYGATAGTCGSVYQLTPSGSNWLFSTLARLPKSCIPEARVTFGPDGHPYGASFYGGKYSGGTVFRLTPPVGICKDAACYWTVADLHDFADNEGYHPYGDLSWDQLGNLYGTTENGGITFGTVYELTPSGNGYTESVLYNFSDTDGAFPLGGVVPDNKGNLFGVTYGGGSGSCFQGCGTVFELTYVPGVGWTEHVLYNFQGTGDGEWPTGGLIFDSAGNLYGSTGQGGSGGGGTVFELSPSGNTWTFKLLYSFSVPNCDLGVTCGPATPLSMDGAGNLYGTTVYDGNYQVGNVFKLSKTQNGWVYASLHDFTGGSDGGRFVGNVSIDTDGTLYGTTQMGGDPICGCGVVWMIKP